MFKNKLKKFLIFLAPVSLGFLVSCAEIEPDIDINIPHIFKPLFEIPEKSGFFKKQDPRSTDLYVSEVNAIRLKWFLNNASLMNLSDDEKSKIYASKVAKYFVFDNKNRILVHKNTFNVNEEITPTFLKNAFEKAANSYEENAKNNIGNSTNKIAWQNKNIEIYSNISKIFDPNWRFIEMKLIKPNVIFPDKKNYILINAYKIFYTDPIDFSEEKANEIQNNETKTEKYNKKWRIKAPNNDPTPILRLHWYKQSVKNPFKIELNNVENPNSEYDLQMVNNIDQSESVADFSFDFYDNNSIKPKEPLEILHSKPFIRLVLQSYAIPFEDEISNFERGELKFKYQFK